MINRRKKKKLLSLLLLLYKEQNQKKMSSRYFGRFYEDFLENVIDQGNDAVLRKKLRVSCKAFNHILHLLTQSPQFRTWKHRNLKSAVFVLIAKQLCIYLYFISRNMNYDSLADLFGISSTGTICTIINRVADAIVEYKSLYIKWHNEESKQQMLSNASGYGFEDCIALVDGVVNDITSFDKVFTASWTTRKQKYGIVSLVMCDLQDRILFYSTGNCGSRNDSGIWKDDVLPQVNEMTESN